MTLNRDVELLLRAHFEGRADRTVGDGQVAAVLERVASHRQRPGWLAALRSSFMTATAIARPATPRAAWLLAVVGLLGVALLAAFLLAGAPRSMDPVNGLIVFGRFDEALGDTVVYVVNPDGTGVRQLRPEVHEGPHWSPDGERIALGGSVIDADGSNFRTWDTTDHSMSLYCWDWSPDGLRMLCEGWSETVGEEDVHGIYTVRASDGGDLIRLSVPGDSGVPGMYSPDGSMIVYIGTIDGVQGALIVMNVDGTNRHRVGTLGDMYDPRWAPDGQSVLVGRQGSLLSIEIGTGAPRPLAIRSAPNVTLGAGQWSPDGTRILFRRHIADDNWDLFTMLPDGTDLVQVTDNPDDDRFFDWGTQPVQG